MDRKVIKTDDGSTTIIVTEQELTFHSRHGAIQESQHVFIQPGFHRVAAAIRENLSILEMGFGTGLNALLTLAASDRHIYYETIEAYPLEPALTRQLNYCDQLKRPDLQTVFERLHECEWNKPVGITPGFTIKKVNTGLDRFHSDRSFHLVYFDAFDPVAQPELWTTAVFEKMFQLLCPGGILVTYSSKGTVRRAMQAAGFIVEKIPGPPGKREIVRAVRPPL